MGNDSNIRNDVLAELKFEPQVADAAVGVTVADGVVTLSGHVSSYAEKLAAEAAAKRVKGVRAIAEDIEVRLPYEVVHDDAEIAKRAANIMTWNIVAPKTGVKVKVENGWVTLSGEVDWTYKREEVERIVRHLTGVRGVTNLITLRSGIKQGDVKSQIKKAFHRNAEIDASGIEIGIDGGKVTLSGDVKLWREREMAENAVWAVPGVYQVIDKLVVI
ncbi:ornithine aminotransferase [Caulobacter sp. CCUG 60055]|uniref:BON domain-containing protein n=1 Tax=Caulobacter sp. CCUG 60055 TaxID=2100090 RepID=UPI001FA7CC01|nr:BON domain-containing protein [Caulobacter sp. CCUG 60055]MCI3179246.1 ornithine aminotransferase [Caulobacter sp. CCUG 60055]